MVHTMVYAKFIYRLLVSSALCLEHVETLLRLLGPGWAPGTGTLGLGAGTVSGAAKAEKRPYEPCGSS